MKYLLRIGCDEYLLPDNRGLSTVMETLSRARLVCEPRVYDERYQLTSFRHGPPPTLEVKALPGSWRTVKRADDSEFVDCDVLPPERGALPAARARARLAGGRLMLEGGAE